MTDNQQTKDVIYEIPCKQSIAVYMGWTSRTLKIRLNEHKSAMHKNSDCKIVDHAMKTDHFEFWKFF